MYLELSCIQSNVNRIEKLGSADFADVSHIMLKELGQYTKRNSEIKTVSLFHHQRTPVFTLIVHSGTVFFAIPTRQKIKEIAGTQARIILSEAYIRFLQQTDDLDCMTHEQKHRFVC